MSESRFKETLLTLSVIKDNNDDRYYNVKTKGNTTLFLNWQKKQQKKTFFEIELNQLISQLSENEYVLRIA